MIAFKKISTVSVVTLILLTVIIWPKLSECKIDAGRYGLYAINPEKVMPGFTALAPISYTKDSGPGKIYLLDMWGNAVHTWKTPRPINSFIVTKDARLFVGESLPIGAWATPSGGGINRILELDWDSTVLWEYKNERLHHDFDILPNGNIIALTWEQMPTYTSKRVSGGIPGTDSPDGKMWSDTIIEIDRSGKTVWKWNLFEHLTPEEHPLNQSAKRIEWTHANSLRYITSDPLTNNEAILLSARHANTVLLANKKTERIIWKSPHEMTDSQHDASLLPNGNILVFDNGHYRKNNTPAGIGARVIEIDPKQNTIVWEFSPGKTPLEKYQFAGSIVGTTQRLPNGNTLVGNGLHGELLEIAPDGSVVWDFLNPYFSYSTGPFPNNAFFRARKYLSEEIAWPKKMPNPFGSIVCRLKAKNI